MQNYLVEAYVGRAEPEQVEALARRAESVAERTAGIRYLGSLVLADDEVCFHLFEAPSLEAIVAASDRVALAGDRVVETIWIAPAA